jgi:outer membrane immunogenic protein
VARARFSAPRDTGGDVSPSHLTGLAASASGNQNGWTAGAGVEWQFAPHWTAKVEYQHLQFDSVSRDFNYAGFPTAFRHFASNSGTDTVRVGVNYLFNAGGPVLAKY